MPTLKYSYSIPANEPVPCLSTVQGPDPKTGARCQLLRWARMWRPGMGTRAEHCDRSERNQAESSPSELLGHSRHWAEVAGWVVGLPHSRSPPALMPTLLSACLIFPASEGHK